MAGSKATGAGLCHFVNIPDPPACDVAVSLNPDQSGYTLEAAIPFAARGFMPETGRELRFDLAIDDSANGTRRERQLMWNGIARNSGDRTAWGRARLTGQ